MAPLFSLVFFLVADSLDAVSTGERETGWSSAGESLPGVPVCTMTNLMSCLSCLLYRRTWAHREMVEWKERSSVA